MKYSVVIPLYNKEKHIARAIHSVLSQSYNDFEVIVVDDGSTDGGLGIVNQFDDKRIRVYQQANAGVSSARNKGIRNARGDYIAFLDADDEWLENNLESFEEMISKFPDAGLYATAYEIYESTDKVISPWDKKSFCQNGLINKIDYFKESYKSALRPVCASTVCIPKRILDVYGGFKEGCHHGEDIYLWGQIALDNSVIFNCNVSARRYLDTENQSKDTRPVAQYELPFVTFYRKNCKAIDEKTGNPYVKEFAAAQELTVVRRLLKVGNRSAAWKVLVGIKTKHQRKKLLQFYLASIVPTFILKGYLNVKKEKDQWQ